MIEDEAWQALRRQLTIEQHARVRREPVKPRPVDDDEPTYTLPDPDPHALRHREQLARHVGVDPAHEFAERPGDRYAAALRAMRNEDE